MEETKIMPHTAAKAELLGLGSVGNIASWLVERYGPALADILLDILGKKSNRGILPNASDLFGAFDVRVMAEMLLERYGQQLLEHVAAQLSTSDNLLLKFAGEFATKHSAEVLAWVSSWLASPEGQKAFAKAVGEDSKA